MSKTVALLVKTRIRTKSMLAGGVPARPERGIHLHFIHILATRESMNLKESRFETPMPTGLRITAQGCLPSGVLLTKEGEATLGKGAEESSTPTGPQRGWRYLRSVT